jgi:hypothetical protein
LIKSDIIVVMKKKVMIIIDEDEGSAEMQIVSGPVNTDVLQKAFYALIASFNEESVVRVDSKGLN